MKETHTRCQLLGCILRLQKCTFVIMATEQNAPKQNEDGKLTTKPVWDKLYSYGPAVALIVVMLSQRGNDIKTWVEQMFNRLSGKTSSKSGSGDGDGVNTTKLNRKLKALDAKFFGSTACKWTVKQLKDLNGVGVDFVDCDKDPKGCGSIQAYPTWSIGGIQKPGYMPVDALENLLDSILIAAYESSKDESKAKVVDDTTTEVVEEEKVEEKLEEEEKNEEEEIEEKDITEADEGDDEAFEIGVEAAKASSD